MRIANNIEALELTMALMGNPSVIHPTLIWDENGATLIDTGVPGQFEDIKAAIENVGLSFSNLRRVILTHQDVDHIGSLADILEAGGGKIEVYAHADDVPYIEGEKPLIKMDMSRFEGLFASLPEDVREKVKAQFANLQTSKVTHTLEDGETFPFHKGIKIIHTPGHTPGHISLFIEDEKLLIAGDAMVVDAEGILQGPREAVTPDMEKAMASIAKLSAYPIDRVLCYHGGLYGPNASARIKEISQNA
jgi:glyoxylase-like metal-dependent hydrolase (beta-lactamase superfamily II)